MKIGIITISDTRSFEDDDSGQKVIEALRGYGFETFETVIVADELAHIRNAIRHMSNDSAAIFTIGGTGFSPRDVTPEATVAVLDRRADNLSDLIRARCSEHSPTGALTRGVAGMVGDTLVVNLPGSPTSAVHGLHAVGGMLERILCQLRGDPDRAGVGC